MGTRAPSGASPGGASSQPSSTGSRHAGPAAAIALSLNASALYLGIALGSVLGGAVVRTAAADALWLPASACGAIALLLLPISITSTQRAASRRPA